MSSPGRSPGRRRKLDPSSPWQRSPPEEEEEEDSFRYNLRGSPRGTPSSGDDSKDSVDYVDSDLSRSRSPARPRRRIHDTRASRSPKDDLDRSGTRSPGDGKLYPDLPPRDESPLYPSLSPDNKNIKKSPSPNFPKIGPQVTPSANQTKNVHSFQDISSTGDLLQWIFNNIWAVLMFIAVVVVFLLIYNSSSTAHIEPSVMDSEDEAYRREQTVKEFTKELSDLKQKIQNQDGKLWRIVQAATKRVLLDANPIQPAVFILAYKSESLDAKYAAECIANSLVHIICSVTSSCHGNTVSIPPASEKQNSDNVKLKLDQDLKAALSSGAEAVWVKNLGELDGNGAMLLHAYCDNENAPFKRATIIFTLGIKHNEDFPSSRWDSVVEQSLESLWEGEMGVDNVHALLSRVANNIAIVNAEDRHKLYQSGTCSNDMNS